MTVSVHPEADAEFAAAVDWYELQRIGPGDEFEQDVFDAFDLIAECPHAWSKWPGLDAVQCVSARPVPVLAAVLRSRRSRGDSYTGACEATTRLLAFAIAAEIGRVGHHVHGEAVETCLEDQASTAGGCRDCS